MKYKINLVGNTFTHLTDGNKGYSVARKESKYIEWMQDFSANETVYIDQDIYKAFNDNIPGIKYAWLFESKYIAEFIVENIKANLNEFLKVFKYIFTHNQELLKLDDRFKFVPANGCWIMEPNIYEKSKLISMITSTKQMTQGHRIRAEWINKLKNDIDLYGRGIKEIYMKEEGLCDYMFSVAIENGFYESYFTEKILDCFATGTVPVYLGTPDIGKYFNTDGIIFLTKDFKVSDLTPELYYSKMEAIKDNLERVKNMDLNSLEDYIYLRYLTVNN